MPLRVVKCKVCGRDGKWGDLLDNFWSIYEPVLIGEELTKDICPWCSRNFKLKEIDPGRKARLRAKGKKSQHALPFGHGKMGKPSPFFYCHICDEANVSRKHMEGHLADKIM